MAKTKHRISRRTKQTSVWEAFNEPIAHPTQQFTQYFFPVALFILMMAWLMPYWHSTQVVAYYEPPQQLVSYSGFFTPEPVQAHEGVVAGATTYYNNEQNEYSFYSSLVVTGESFQTFYHDNIQKPFAVATNQILDVSSAVSVQVDFLQPGVSAVWNAWLELMADPPQLAQTAYAY